MNTIYLKLSLSILLSIMVLPLLIGQDFQKRRGGGQSHSVVDVGPELLNCRQQWGLNTTKFWECVCDIPFFDCTQVPGYPNSGGNLPLISHSDETTLTPTVLYTPSKFRIDTKLDHVSNIKIQIFDIYTSELMYDKQHTNVSSVIDYDYISLSDGFYLVVMNIDGITTIQKLAVFN